MNEFDVVVAGGGPAGLAAALEAARRGLRTRLIEASPYLGGMAGSFCVAGQRVDFGSHRLHTAAGPRVRLLLDQLLGTDLQLRERNGRLRLSDRWVAFPFRPADLLASLPPSFVAAAAIDTIARPLRREACDSYGEVVRVGLGRTALADFHGPMATKLWGVPPEQLSGELARKRLPVRSALGLARKILTSSRPQGRTFLYPRKGFGQIVDRLGEAAVDAGTIVSTGTRIASLDPAEDSTIIRLDSGDPIRARRVLWTASPSSLAEAVGNSVEGPAPVDVPYRGLVLAYLVVPTTSYTAFDAHYVPDPAVAFSRLSEPRNYRDGSDPAGQTVLCAEIPCTPGDQTWSADAEAIQTMVLDGLGRCDLPRPDVIHAELRHLPSVYPVLSVDDARRRQSVLDWTGTVPGVTVLGRQGRVVADNLHHVLDMALSAVDCLDETASWKAMAWERASRRFETFVVED